MLRGLKPQLCLITNPAAQRFAGAVGAGAIALCCALPLIVAGGVGAAVSEVIFGPIGLAVTIAAVLGAVAWTTRRRLMNVSATGLRRGRKERTG